MTTNRQFYASVIITAFLFIFGFYCLVWPEHVRASALKHSGGRLAQRLNPFLGWMKTSQYIWSLRIAGAMALCVALLVTIVLFTNRR